VTTSIVDPDTRKRDGRALRDVVPLEDHAHVDTVDRPDPIALLTAQDATRLEELVPIRHQRMALRCRRAGP
jgi:hypothetical protein